MPLLDNQRHEAFAREIAKGAAASAAYKAAGYKATGNGAEVNGSKLLRNAKVQSRIAELQQMASKRTEISIAQLTEDLLRLAKKGEGFDTESGTNAARQCLMDAAKLNGLIVERHENENRNTTISADPEPVGEEAEAEWARRQSLQ